MQKVVFRVVDRFQIPAAAAASSASSAAALPPAASRGAGPKEEVTKAVPFVEVRRVEEERRVEKEPEERQEASRGAAAPAKEPEERQEA